MIEDFNRFYAGLKSTADIRVPKNQVENIYRLAMGANSLDGSFAEVGVYRGGTAKAIAEGKLPSKRLYLFDTFEGFKNVKQNKLKGDNWDFHTGMLVGELEQVKKYLGSYPNLTFYKGMFPETAEECKNESFAFVHMDCDFYQCTLDGLNFFFPRLVKDGIMVFHDWNRRVLWGMTQAVKEYFKERKDFKTIRTIGEQLSIIKTS